MGKIGYTVKRTSRLVRSEISFVSIEEVSESELIELTAPDPYAVLRAKTKQVAELLRCSEPEAERLILSRIV